MNDTKAKIVAAVDAFPEGRQREVLEDVKSLRSREEAKAEEERDPTDNPLPDFTGEVEHGASVQDIDEELYGE